VAEPVMQRVVGHGIRSQIAALGVGRRHRRAIDEPHRVTVPESAYRPMYFLKPWIPAFAGMTM
jgi:hypothetical protein